VVDLRLAIYAGRVSTGTRYESRRIIMAREDARPPINATLSTVPPSVFSSASPLAYDAPPAPGNLCPLACRWKRYSVLSNAWLSPRGCVQKSSTGRGFGVEMPACFRLVSAGMFNCNTNIILHSIEHNFLPPHCSWTVVEHSLTYRRHKIFCLANYSVLVRLALGRCLRNRVEIFPFGGMSPAQ